MVIAMLVNATCNRYHRHEWTAEWQSVVYPLLLALPSARPAKSPHWCPSRERMHTHTSTHTTLAGELTTEETGVATRLPTPKHPPSSLTLNPPRSIRSRGHAGAT